MKLDFLTNFNLLFSFLELIFTTLDDLGEMRSRDLLVGVAHSSKIKQT